uniref:Uncharacterized protein n=1 Tax=Anguilla anguilla TaxID=7936 RepID=A0A0E9XQR7_ANGAN
MMCKSQEKKQRQNTKNLLTSGSIWVY